MTDTDSFAKLDGDPKIPNPLPVRKDIKGVRIALDEAGFKEQLDDFIEKNPDMNHYSNGQPRNLAIAWHDIQRIRDLILNAQSAAGFRADIEDKIAKTGSIRNAVCVGMGHPGLHGQQTRMCWIHQFAVFLAICQMIEDQKRIELPQLIFADPGFNFSAVYVIEALAGCKVVKDAFDGHVNEQSFVYGIHLPHTVAAQGVLAVGKHPELYMGNWVTATGSGIGFAVAGMYVKHVHLKKTLEMPAHLQKMIDQALLFHSTHDRFPATFDYDNMQVHHAYFRGTYTFIRRKEPLDLEEMINPSEKAEESKLSTGDSSRD